LLFGETEVTNESGTMDTFYLQTGIGSALCAEMPGSGILIQTPEGAGEVEMTINGITINMGSTLYVRAVAGDATYISVLEGNAEVTAMGTTRRVPAGSSVVVPIDADLNASRAPLPVGLYPAEIIQGLPLALLPQEIVVTYAEPTPEPEQATPAPSFSGAVYHTVQRGENLFRIALYYDTSIESIATANNLADPRQIYAGQVLLIPNPGSGYQGLPTSPLLPPAGTPIPGTTVTPSGVFVPAEGGYIHEWNSGGRAVYNLDNVDPGRTFYLNTDLGNFLFTVDNVDRYTFHGRTYDQELISITFTSVSTYQGCASWFNSCFKGGQ
jgi:LysM repeat protein